MGKILCRCGIVALPLALIADCGGSAGTARTASS
jgi:hypothetical protein